MLPCNVSLFLRYHQSHATSRVKIYERLKIRYRDLNGSKDVEPMDNGVQQTRVKGDDEISRI